MTKQLPYGKKMPPRKLYQYFMCAKEIQLTLTFFVLGLRMDEREIIFNVGIWMQ